MLAEKLESNRVNLPDVIAKQFSDIRYFDANVENGCIVLHPVFGDALTEIQDKFEALGITPDDIADAVKWARSGKNA